MFSKSCEYGLQAIIYIALNASENKKVGLKEIAEQQEIPTQYLSKILQQLVKHKILDSMKGPNGGFFLKKNPEKLTLLEVVTIIDGTDLFDQCGIGLKKCTDKNPCPIHHEYKLVKAQIKKIFEEKSISQLCNDIHEGKSILNFNSSNQLSLARH